MALRNNGGGNPYHDENGRFTSKGSSGSGGISEEKRKVMDMGFSPNNPKEVVNEPSDDELIDKALNDLIDRRKRWGVENPVPDEDWYEYLYNQLKTNGVPEDKLRRLSDKFYDRMIKEKDVKDNELIDKSLNNLIDYAKKFGAKNPTPNSDWYDDLYYQLGNDGVPEEKIKGLMDKFKSRMKEKEDDQLIDKSLNNLIDYAKKIGISNPVPNSDWTDDLYYQLSTDGVPEDKIRGLLDRFNSRMNNKKIQDMGFSPYNKK